MSQIEGTKTEVARSNVFDILRDNKNDEFIFNFKEVLEIENDFNITKRNVLRTRVLRSTRIHAANCDEHENIFSKAMYRKVRAGCRIIR